MTRQGLLRAQQEVCLKLEWPHFAPSDGVCWNCGKDCVTPRWAVEPITGCPRCHYSFCE